MTGDLENSDFRLFHGTTTKALLDIRREGLVPQVSKDQANRGNHKVARRGIYLTSDYHTAVDAAEVACDIRSGGDIVVLEIDVSQIDVTALEPDDYDLQDRIDGGEEGPDGIDPRVAHLRDWSEASWQLSLEVTSEVFYAKAIPPSAIRQVVPRKQVRPG